MPVDKKEAANLSLVLMDPTNSGGAQADEEEPKKLSKKERRKQKTAKSRSSETEAKEILQSARWGKLVDDPRFARDPTSTRYDPENPMNKFIVEEKSKRRQPEDDDGVRRSNKTSVDSEKTKKTEASNLAQMVAKIKRKTNEQTNTLPTPDTRRKNSTATSSEKRKPPKQ